MTMWMWCRCTTGLTKNRRCMIILAGWSVSLTEAHLRFTDENGKVREVFSKPGEARWYPPFKHKVENLGDTTYDAVYIGIKGKLAASNGSTDPTTATDEEVKKIVAEYLAASGKP